MAIKPAITLPASTSQQVQGLGLAKTNYELNYILSYYWERIQVHTNISYARNPYNTNYPISGTYSPYQINLVSASIAPVWIVNSWLKLALDIGSSIDTSTDAAAVNDYGMVAAIFSVDKNIDVGFSYLQSSTTQIMHGLAKGSHPTVPRLVSLGVLREYGSKMRKWSEYKDSNLGPLLPKQVRYQAALHSDRLLL